MVNMPDDNNDMEDPKNTEAVDENEPRLKRPRLPVGQNDETPTTSIEPNKPKGMLKIMFYISSTQIRGRISPHNS